MKYYTRIGEHAFAFAFERRGDQILAHVSGGEGVAERTLVVDLAMVGDGTAFSMLVDGSCYGAPRWRCSTSANAQRRWSRVRGPRVRSRSAR